jgi:HK97 gp10 family phage protein
MPAKLTSRLPQIAASIPVRVGAAVREGTEGIAAEARTFAPDRTPLGQGLPDSIEARDGEDGYGIYANFYWRFNEFGTTRQAARPFMIPALERGKDEVANLVTAALRGL